MGFIDKLKQGFLGKEENKQYSETIHEYDTIPNSTLGKQVWMYRSTLRTDIMKNLNESVSKELQNKMREIWNNGKKENKKERRNKLKKLKTLRITYNSLIEDQRKEQLNLLQDYDITSNKDNLTTGSKERLKEATELSFGNNKILEELPERIKDMTNLSYLSINNTPKLKKLPNRITDLPIEKLDLIDTGIKKFQEEILPFLKKLKEQDQITIKQTPKKVTKEKTFEEEFGKEFNKVPGEE